MKRLNLKNLMDARAFALASDLMDEYNILITKLSVFGFISLDEAIVCLKGDVSNE